jgi:dethiobiotin synthase
VTDHLAFVICGTDTGVGKTIVAAGIAACALGAGRSVTVLKPVQTGADTDDDAATTDRLVGATVAATGWRLRLPLAPAVAARLEKQRLSAAEVVRWVEANSDTDVVVVETAGGVAVELEEGFDMAALAARLDMSTVLVCRAGLGTLNHTLLSVNHLQRAGGRVMGLVLTNPSGAIDISGATNPLELERLARVSIAGALGPMPLSEPRRFCEAAKTGLAPALGGRFDRAHFLADMTTRAQSLMWGE